MATPFESGCDPVSPNRNLAPVSAELDDQGRLMVGGCRLSELAKRYGTPLYVLDEIRELGEKAGPSSIEVLEQKFRSWLES